MVDVTGLDGDDAAERALAALDPGDDIHATAAYRAQLVRVLTRRVLAAATDHATARAAMSEELHDVRLRVNGATHDVRVPARRLLSDALRHDCGLTGTHVGCEHGVCGACTVLLDGRPVRSCLMLAVSAEDAELTTVEGLADGPDGDALSPGAAGLRRQPRPPVRLLHARLPHHDHRRARAPTPTPREDEAREMVAGNLCRCTGYQNIVAAVLRAAEIAAGAAMTTKLFGTKVPRVEDQRLLRGRGRYVDDVLVGQRVLHAAVLRSPHAHARIVDIDVDRRARRRGRPRWSGPTTTSPARWPSRCRC